MHKQEEIKYLEKYLEIKLEEIEKLKTQIISMEEEKEEYIQTVEDIKEKIAELNDNKILSEDNKKHIKSLNNVLEQYNKDIFRLHIEISSTEKILKELESNFELTKKELEILKG